VQADAGIRGFDGGKIEISLGEIKQRDQVSAAGEFDGVAPGSAADVEHVRGGGGQGFVKRLQRQCEFRAVAVEALPFALGAGVVESFDVGFGWHGVLILI